MDKYGHTAVGIKDGMVVYASDELLAQKGKREVMEQLSMVKRFPVQTDLSGNVVMVEADSHEDAVKRYLNRAIKSPNADVTGLAPAKEVNHE